MVMTQVKNASPDMILTAFDVKFRGKKTGCIPGPVDPLNKLEKNNV